MDAKEVLLQYDNYSRKEKFLRSETLQENKLIDALDLIPDRMTRQTKEKLSRVEDHIRIYEEDLDRISIEKKEILDLISSTLDRHSKINFFGICAPNVLFFGKMSELDRK